MFCVQQKLLALTPFPAIEIVVDLCCSQETAIKDSSAINGKINIERIKKTNYQKSKNENFSKENVNHNLTEENCHRCGNENHTFSKCPVGDSMRNICSKNGH